jgi:hypothetical protein
MLEVLAEVQQVLQLQLLEMVELRVEVVLQLQME